MIPMVSTWDYTVLPYGTASIQKPSENSLSMEDVINMLDPVDRLKHLSASKTTIRSFVDVVYKGDSTQENISTDELGEIWKNGVTEKAMAELDEGIRPCRQLQPADIMQIVIGKDSEDARLVLKHFLLKDPVSKSEAATYCAGRLMLLPWRARLTTACIFSTWFQGGWTPQRSSHCMMSVWTSSIFNALL